MRNVASRTWPPAESTSGAKSIVVAGCRDRKNATTLQSRGRQPPFTQMPPPSETNGSGVVQHICGLTGQPEPTPAARRCKPSTSAYVQLSWDRREILTGHPSASASHPFHLGENLFCAQIKITGLQRTNPVIDNLIAENRQTFGIVLEDFGTQRSPAQTRMIGGSGKNVASILAVHSLGTVGQIA
jgi:hypothetical protein